jgi:hypothetical protein
MLIGQSLIAPADGTHKVLGPWFPRQGDKFTAVVEVIKASNIGGGVILQVAYETKHQEDADSAVVGTIGSGLTTSMTAPTTVSFARRRISCSAWCACFVRHPHRSARTL